MCIVYESESIADLGRNKIEGTPILKLAMVKRLKIHPKKN
jgi:hypothetical protein